MFGGISLEKDMHGCSSAIDFFSEISLRLFAKLDILVEVHLDQKKNHIEFFYPYQEGDMWFHSKKSGLTRALSLAMTYVYAKEIKLPACFRTHRNLNKRVKVATYGLGLQRLFYALLHHSRDELGFNFDKTMRPFDQA